MNLHFFSTLIILFFVSLSFGQTINSSCSASDSVNSLYETDVMVNVLDHVISSNSSYQDSIKLPIDSSDRILNAFVAIHNLNTPERDSVVDLYHLHNSYSTLHSVTLYADTNQAWLQSLKSEVVGLTGDQFLDSVLSIYPLKSINYIDFNTLAYDRVTLYFENNINTHAMENLLSVLPGVLFMDEAIVFTPMSYQRPISVQIMEDRIRVSYYYGRSSGFDNISYRQWVFDVYDDCSVEFVGATGSLGREGYYIIDYDLDLEDVVVAPNLFSGEFSVYGLYGGQYVIYDLKGEVVMDGVLDGSESTINMLKELPGSYFITLIKNGKAVTHRLIKQ